MKRRAQGPLVPGRLVIGLTGGIASGKSLALEYFRRHGAFTVSADAVAAEVLTLPACYNRILRRFGRTILTNGILDKRRLAAAVFSAPAGRKWLERLLHPLILERIKELLKRSRKKLAVVEAPLLFEAGLGECFTLTLCVAAPEKDCLRRALGRGWTRAQYAARRDSQLSQQEKAARADLALYNAGSPRELENRVKSICRFLEAAGDRK